MSWTKGRPVLPFALAALIGSLAVVAAWIIDQHVHRDSVLPNVMVADRRVRGMDEAELAAWVRETAERFAGAAVEVRTPGGGGFEATVPELGVAVDEQRTVEEVLAAGRRGSAPSRLFRWARSFLSPLRHPVAVQVDRAALAKVVAERDRGRLHPTEPFFTIRDGRLEGVAGKNGRGVDPNELADALSRTRPTGGTIVVTMDVSSIPPRFTEAEADRLAAEGERLLGDGLEVAAGDKTATLPAASIRPWLRTVPREESLELGVSPDAEILDELAGLLPEAGVRPVNAGFTVSAGRVSITASRTGTACCAPEAAEAVGAALLDPAQRSSPVRLPLETVEPARDEEAARELGIVEEVAAFTTPHNAGEPRVRNIQLMADTLRGTVIEPGGTFSINGIIGPRTKEKGYVEAPIIGADYTFEADVGGGVSQFATTMFNAAFFAGLDITEYYMHGLYISRYPYGREATLSYPSPDLKVRNTTPYGVLVWPTYTDTSITVTLYSTKHLASVEQTGQSRVEREARPPANAPPGTPSPGPCVTVTTERTRTYLDGRTTVDRFSGVYAPAEGWSCPSSR